MTERFDIATFQATIVSFQIGMAAIAMILCTKGPQIATCDS